MKPRRLVLIVLILTVAAAAVYFVKQRSASENGELLVQGNIDIRQVNLGFRVGGRIKEIRVDEGDVVKAGDVIAVLEDGPYVDQVHLAEAQLGSAEAALAKAVNGSRKEDIDQARAQVGQMKANLMNAEANFGRTRDLWAQRVVARSDYDTALATRDSTAAQLASAQANLALLEAGSRYEDIDAAKAEVARTKANLEAAERDVLDCRIVAPTDGVIITRALEPGAIVAAGTTACALNLNSPVWVRTYVSERDLGRVYPGMQASVFTDTRPNEAIPAQVGFVSPVAEFTPKSVETRELRADLVYRLRVIISKPDKFLRQGMPVTVRLLEEKDREQSVPTGNVAN
ncbi:MAG TPA: efflux RND transporter periplasmic adaptor subunit [Chthoniobacterales bacterium]